MTIQNIYGKVEIDGDEYSSSRSLTAIANQGYSFFAWTGDTFDIDEHSAIITVDLSREKHKNIYANFIANASYLANVQQNSHGTASIEENPNGYSWQKTFYAFPDNGYKFVEWAEIGSSTYIDNLNKNDNPLWIQLLRNKPSITVKPFFQEDLDYTRITYDDGSMSYVDSNNTLHCSDFKVKSGQYHDPDFIDETIVSIRLGNNVKVLDERCFMNCKALTSIAAFANTALVDFDFSKLEVSAFASNSFKNTDIKRIENICSSVAMIDSYAFYGCTSLTGVCFPSTLLSIEDYAFNACNNLVSIDCRAYENSIPQICAQTFNPVSSVDGRKFYLQSTQESLIAYNSESPWKQVYDEIDPQAYVWKDISTVFVYDVKPKQMIRVQAEISGNSSTCNVNFNDETTKVFHVIDDTNQISIAFQNQNSITTLSNYAMTIQNNISSFLCNTTRGSLDSKCVSAIIGSNITYLPYYAFKDSKLSSIHLPFTIQDIEYGLLAGNPMTINDISIDNGYTINDNWVVLQNGNCINMFLKTNNAIFNANGKNIKKLTKYCFYGCNNLTEIKLPSTLTSIEYPLASSIKMPNLTTLTIQDNKYFKVKNGKLMSKNEKMIYLQTKNAI